MSSTTELIDLQADNDNPHPSPSPNSKSNFTANTNTNTTDQTDQTTLHSYTYDIETKEPVEEDQIHHTHTHTHTDAGPPDGGFAAWSVVLGAWCALFCSFGWTNSIGTFQTYYETTLLSGYSASTIAWIPSLEVFFMFLMGPIVGTLSDTLGPRSVLVGGTFLHVFGLMMTSISTQYYQVLLSQGVCSAMGLCAIFQPSMSAIPSWFDQRRGTAYGIVATGSSLGGIVFPIMVDRLIKEVGFAWAMRVAAFLILFLLVFSCMFVRARVAPLKLQHQMDREVLVRPFREVKMWLLILGFVFLTFGVYIPIDYLEMAAMSQGMSAAMAQYLVPVLNAGSFFGRMLAGVFSDKVGAYNIFISVGTFTGILVLAVWVPATSNAGSIVFSVLFGFSSGAYFSLAVALVAGIAPPREIGYWTGVLFLFASVGGLTTNPIGGAILQHDDGSYTGMKIYSGVLLIAGSLFVMGTRIRQTGWVLKKKF
ncbi:monocarboxylate transporter [Aspergillus heteromorphus CBS 117.55]|uniref:Monocarboxylate transporter n=1 Tax=Aspergillus heteromorphus CBS 117.55 TaxID=1448321 RepID=A0A317V345_9EURO|nr:monocarboxylate transporter [Aspergillus heteromorphus CBS 117.55]PWY68683.1 monocarboxylate transporter [Aspergillus heteromorphus CBS 117.55]